MARIRVELSDLRRVARECQEASAQLRAVADRCHMALAVHDWEVAHRASVEGLVSNTVNQAAMLSRQIYELGIFLEEKAEAYRAADQEGARRIGEAAVAVMAGAPGPAGGVAPGWAPRPASGAAQGPGRGPAPGPAPRAWEVGNGRLDAIFDRDGVPDLSRVPASEPVLGAQPHSEAAPGVAPPAGAPQAFPLFKQADPAWADLRLHNADWAKYGCTLTSMAMTVQHFRPDVTVDRSFMANLRDAATNAQGDAVWSSADRYLQQQYGLRLDFSAENVPFNRVMAHAATQLEGPSPVPTIVGVYPSNGKPMHWVVVSGFTGDPAAPRPEDFQIHDPGENRATLADLMNAWGRPATAARFVNIRPMG